jgi:hypothetical protein
MGFIKGKLSWLEQRIQKLVEGSAARIIPGGHPMGDLGSQIVDILRLQLRIDENGNALAPNLLVLQVHPEMAEILTSNRTLVDELRQTLLEAGLELGFDYPSPPVVQVAATKHIAMGQVKVEALFSQDDLVETTAVEIRRSNGSANIPGNAYLIVDGTKLFPLAQAVINIGRGAENQLVLDSPQVSRHHAQIRLVRGQFMIFDLNSSGGTWVNGRRAQQMSLLPGDVVSISGVPLVFGQDQSPEGETQDLMIIPPEDKT